MKWRRIIGGCALFAWLAVLPPSGSGNLLAAQGGALLQEVLRDPLAILSDRSPGERRSGTLTQSKPHLAAGPSERVLSPVLDRPANPIPVNLDNLPARALEVIDPGTSAIPGAPGNSIAAPPLPIPGLPGSSGGVIPPNAGNGGGTIPPAPPPAPPLQVVSPVPEPATWIMMIVGVALIGQQLRRRQAARSAAPA